MKCGEQRKQEVGLGQGAHAQARALRVQRVQLSAGALADLQRRDALRQRRQRGILLRQQHLAWERLVSKSML